MFVRLRQRSVICARSSRWWTAGVLLLALAVPVGAQTRQDEARKTREEKARALSPYKPGKIEHGLIWLEEGGYLARLFNPPNGFFPQFGHLTPGAGIAFGAGYRNNRMLGGTTDFLGTVTTSTKRYFKIELGLRLPRLANNHLFAEAAVQRSNFPEEDFYGLGPDTAPGDRTNFSIRTSGISGGGGVRVLPFLSVGERLYYFSPSVSPGEEDDNPSIETKFDEATAPGLTFQPNFLQSQTYVDLDYRRPGPNARNGVRYFAGYSRFSDRHDGTYSFDRWDFEFQNYVSILDDHRTLVLRALMAFTSPDADTVVPFYLMPWVGGSHMLRSVRSFRFRDRNFLMLQAEYRWEILSFLSGALFYDRGMVAPERSAITWDGMDDDYGIGFRWGGAGGVAVRTDVAFGGDEGTRFMLRFNNVF